MVLTGPANQRDDGKLEEMLEAFPVLTDGDLRKTVHTQPRELSGDRGYGFPYLIALLLLFGVISRLSPRGKRYPLGSGLGQQRYVVERTLSWWTHFRRLNLCHECRANISRACTFWRPSFAPTNFARPGQGTRAMPHDGYETTS